MDLGAFEFFRNNFIVGTWAGRYSPADWAKKVGFEAAVCENLSKKIMNRKDLHEYLDEPTVSIEQSVIAILAWGGMRITNGKSFRNSLLLRDGDLQKKFYNVCTEMKSRALGRKDAYEKFNVLRTTDDNKISGLGPAYFAKLMYFLNKREVCYIMDQWTALSVNLIGDQTGQHFIRTTFWGSKRKGPRGYSVSDTNSGEIYDRFCKAIELYGKKLKKDPHQVEAALFSQGWINKQKPLPWRIYVRKHYGLWPKK